MCHLQSSRPTRYHIVFISMIRGAMHPAINLPVRARRISGGRAVFEVCRSWGLWSSLMFRDSSWAASWLCFASGVEHRIYVLVIALAVVGYTAVPICPFSSALVAASPLLSVLCTLKFRPHTLHNFYSPRPVIISMPPSILFFMVPFPFFLSF